MPLYPAIEPYNQEFLKVSDIHTIFFEECGNPNGKPVVFIHGDPGGGIQPNYDNILIQRNIELFL